jgi:hypothetical protein
MRRPTGWSVRQVRFIERVLGSSALDSLDSTSSVRLWDDGQPKWLSSTGNSRRQGRSLDSPRCFARRKQCPNHARRGPNLRPGRPGEVGLIAESEIRSEPGQVRISIGEPLQSLPHPNLATVARQRHADYVAEGTTEVERGDSHHTGTLGQSEVGLVGKELSDVIGDR